MPRRPDPPTPPHDGGNRRAMPPRSGQSLAIDTTAANHTRIRPIAASPPPTPHSSRYDKLSFRLRSNSGLSLHTNEDALRRYTDYNTDGSPRTPTFDTNAWGSIDGVAVGPRPTLGRQSSNGTSDSSLPIPDFFSAATFQMVLAHSPTRERLLRLARRHGSAQDVEYLLGVAKYSQSVAQYVEQLAAVPRPVDLPFALSRSLNVDLKHLSSAVLPGLSTVFSDSAAYVEQRVRSTTYPAFVAQQLSFRAAAALSNDAGSRPSELRGLGTSFFLADAQHVDAPITSVSDGFLTLSGYTREETLLRSFSFLEGSKTDDAAATRIANAIEHRREVSEVILNYRRDSWPFWNLMTLLPLRDEDGLVRRYLCGYVNVSDTLANQDDILRAMSHGSSLGDASDTEEDDDAHIGRRTSARDCAPDRKTSVRQRSGSTRGFFKQFKKAPGGPASHSTSASISLPSTRSPSFDDSHEGLHHYSRYMLLRLAASSPSPSASDSPKRSTSPTLRVVCASPATLELLDIQSTPASCQGMDAFSLLAHGAASSAVTKAFKTTILQKVLRDGQCEKLNISLGRSQHRRHGSVSTPPLTSRSNVDVRDSRGEKGMERRPSRPVSRSGFASFVNGESSKDDVVMSHWTPLKDAGGTVEYVVVILSPA